MIKTLFKNEKLFQQTVYILASLFLLRILAHIPVPWVDPELLTQAGESSLLSYVNMFSGTVFASYTFGSIGISAYISASILIQTAGFFIKPLHRLRTEPGGQKILKKITLYIGVIIAFITSWLTTSMLDKQYEILLDDSWYVFLIIALIHAASTAACVLTGEKITETGFSEGISLLITVNILAGLPHIIQNAATKYQTDIYTNQSIAILAAVLFLMFLGSAFMEKSEKRIPVIYQKGNASQLAMTDQDSTLRIRLNMTGIMPIIYFAYLYQAISWIAEVSGNTTFILLTQSFSYGTSAYMIFACIFILLFSIFYTYIIIDTNQIAYFLQIKGGLISGIRPGRDTAVFLRKEVNRISVIGAVFLAALTTVPFFILQHFQLNIIETSSVMILMGTALTTIRTLQVEFDIASDKNNLHF